MSFRVLEEYIGETGVDKTKSYDRIRVFRQYLKQAEHQETKVEEFPEDILLKYSLSLNAVKSIQKT